jgi:hypothetical protein
VLELASRIVFQTEGQQILHALEPVHEEGVELGAQGDLPTAQATGQAPHAQGNADPVQGEEQERHQGQLGVEPR